MTHYHYTSGDGLLSILESDSLHCSHNRFLNDPTEMKYFEEVLELVFAKNPQVKHVYDVLENTSYRETALHPFDIFIASFSKNGDSLSMWNYYAKGNGYNLEMDIDSIIELNQKAGLIIQKVDMIYDSDLQIKELTDFLLSNEIQAEKVQSLYSELAKVQSSDFEEYYECNFQLNGLIEPFNDKLAKFMLEFKHPAYHQEEEIRLLISKGVSSDSKIKFRVTPNGVLRPYIELKLELESNLGSITSHPLSNALHVEGVKIFASERKLKDKLEVKKSKIPFRMV